MTSRYNVSNSKKIARLSGGVRNSQLRQSLECVPSAPPNQVAVFVETWWRETNFAADARGHASQRRRFRGVLNRLEDSLYHTARHPGHIERPNPLGCRARSNDSSERADDESAVGESSRIRSEACVAAHRIEPKRP